MAENREPVGHAEPDASWRADPVQDVHTMTDLGVYTAEGRLPDEPTLADALRRAREVGGFVWLGLANPTAEEVVAVGRELALPHLAVEDAVTAHQRPKLEVYDDLVFMVLRPVRYVDRVEKVDVAEVAVFLGADFVVTVRHGESDVLRRVRAELDHADAKLLAFGRSAVLYRAADLVVDDYERVVTDLDVDVDEIEEEVFGPDEDDHSQRIYRLKEEVAQFRRAIAGLHRPLERLVAGEVPHVAETSDAYFRDVHDHALRAWEAVEVIDRQLTDVLQANTARVSMVQNRIALRQNEDMRKISAWAAMALVPTLIAGVFGMNLSLWPNNGLWWGFPVVLVSMVGVCVVLYRAFRRNGWL